MRWLFGMFALCLVSFPALAGPGSWREEWPDTDFSRHAVDYDEIISGGPPKDGIPAIDDPQFVTVAEATDLADTEPVIGLTVNGDARAYPLRVLIWHEIVNDTVGGIPVAVTFCPLCNAAIVFDRRHDGLVLDFGTTGKLRHSDLVMYDRQSESWWQQFTGAGIVGKYTGASLGLLPSRLESFARFRDRAPGGRVLVPTRPEARLYGINPYAGYDSSGFPFLYRGELPEGMAPLARVIVSGERAWPLELLRERRRIETDDGLILTWTPGQNSALDAPEIARGWDVGNVLVQRRNGTTGQLADVVHRVDFAFALYAFRPDIKVVGR
jgi:hypothetical protein